MLVSYPLVNDRGEPTGAEVTFRFGDIVSIENLLSYIDRDHRQEERQRYRVLPDCINITLRNEHEFSVQADYNELKKTIRELSEWTE